MDAMSFIRDHLFALWSRDASDPARQLLQEHEALRVQLREAQREVAVRARDAKRGRAVAAARRVCVRELTALERALVEHFRIEEEGSSLADVLKAAPRYFDRAAALHTEHAVLVEEIGAICDLAKVCGRSVERWSELEWRLTTLARRLEEHERAESEISSLVYLEDIGTQG